MDSNWKRLLDYWQGPLGRHALSFSFMLGALRAYSEGDSFARLDTREAIRRLIDEIRSYHTDGYHHYIYRCPDIGVLVIRKVTSDLAPSPSIAIESAVAKGKTSLFVSDDIQHNSGSALDDLLQTIWEESGSAIEREHYSRNGHTFSPFSEYDKRAILKAFA